MALETAPDPMPYLRYLPTIAKWIETNKRISGFEMAIFKVSYPEVFGFFKTSDYQRIASAIAPYSEEPRYGHYVRLALSPMGKQWIEYAIDLIKKS